MTGRHNIRSRDFVNNLQRADVELDRQLTALRETQHLGMHRVFNVQNQGAAGDGTTDDSGVIKQVEEEWRVNGGILYFPNLIDRPGTYRFEMQNPPDDAAVYSDTDRSYVVFDPGARLIMDNLSAGAATSHGILFAGPCAEVGVINGDVRWEPAATVRSSGDGYRFEGYPSDGNTIYRPQLLNCFTSGCAATGAIFHACSNPSVYNFHCEWTKADGLHFNACRRPMVFGVTGLGNGDDTLAFQTYRDPGTQPGSIVAGGFGRTTWDDWCNSFGHASGIISEGSGARGIGMSMGHGISITDFVLRDPAIGGIHLNAADGPNIYEKAGASQFCTFANGYITGIDNADGITMTGVNLANPPNWWDFRGTHFHHINIVYSSGCNRPFAFYEAVGYAADHIRARGSGAALGGLCAGRDFNVDPESLICDNGVEYSYAQQSYRVGTIADKPPVGRVPIGSQYYVTDTGKPAWLDGSGVWRYADGTAV